MSKRDIWYMYENDSYGVNGLLTFNGKDALASYIATSDFYDDRDAEDISDADKAKLIQYSEQFKSGKIDGEELATDLLIVLQENEGEIDEIIIEDFESICEGKTEFAQMAIEIFCEAQDIDVIDVVPEAMKSGFETFLATAHENWIG